MMWGYYVVAGWLLIGLVTVSICVYDGYKDGDDLTLGDLGMVFVTTLTGPIFAIWLLKEAAKENAGTVLVKGKKVERNDN